MFAHYTHMETRTMKIDGNCPKKSVVLCNAISSTAAAAKSQESHDFQKIFRQNHCMETALNVRLLPDHEVYRNRCYQLYSRIELVN